MGLEIIGTESLGVRGLSCRVTLPGRSIVIDPGVSLGFRRYGLLPHPIQIAVGIKVRNQICHALTTATDVVFSHFHGDHVPLLDANPYQLSFQDLPSSFPDLRCWSKSDDDLSDGMRTRFHHLANLMGTNMQIAESYSEGPLSFSRAGPHGNPDSNMGTVMMTRIKMNRRIFLHASDIQLLDDSTIQLIIEWQPDILLASGPPLYLNRLSSFDKTRAWANGLRLARNIKAVILDHHLMRGKKGAIWLDKLSMKAGKKIYCAADFMGQPRQLLEANRIHLYTRMPVPETWHDDYAKGLVDPDEYSQKLQK
jgi:hypothetical protein